MQSAEERGRAGEGLWEKELEALRMDLAGLGRGEAEGQRPVGWGVRGGGLQVLGFSGPPAAGRVGKCLWVWVFTAPGESRSRRRWGLSRLRKDKGLSQPNLSAGAQEDLGHQYVRSESGNRGQLGE